MCPPGFSDELSAVVRSRSVDAAVANRPRTVLWRDEGHSANEVAALAGVSRPTVNTWVHRYTEACLDGLFDQPEPGEPAQVPAQRRRR